jgi:UDP-N-acetylmuramate dehydrogenase
MKVVERPSLQSMNSFGLTASAGLLIAAESEEDVLALPPFDPARDLVLGGGSNVVLATDVPGTVFHNCIRGRQLIEDTGDTALLEVGAGEDWHELVCWTLDHGLSGLENLSLIPGLAGAAPMQNIGAYGVELSAVLERVTAWDWQRCAWTSFGAEDCRLSYRDSLFKSGCPDRYLITSIRLRLDRVFQPRLDYAGLVDELTAMGVAQPSARQVSEAVIRLRRRKLPDPALAGNAGSFFKNPRVGPERAEELAGAYPDLPQWPADEGQTKLSAAWMIERCGLKGFRMGAAAVSEQHALVLVNLGGASGREIVDLARKVQETVAGHFGIALEPEPKLVEFDT